MSRYGNGKHADQQKNLSHRPKEQNLAAFSSESPRYSGSRRKWPFREFTAVGSTGWPVAGRLRPPRAAWHFVLLPAAFAPSPLRMACASGFSLSRPSASSRRPAPLVVCGGRRRCCRYLAPRRGRARRFRTPRCRPPPSPRTPRATSNRHRPGNWGSCLPGRCPGWTAPPADPPHRSRQSRPRRGRRRETSVRSRTARCSNPPLARRFAHRRLRTTASPYAKPARAFGQKTAGVRSAVGSRRNRSGSKWRHCCATILGDVSGDPRRPRSRQLSTRRSRPQQREVSRPRP
mmetsp:Transcript_9747/g.24052  ORF Transcript_9747/g.24052 Transcript_9747/m.24052 type:complete len:289 (-) Transcript_9747:3556-4422(-)